MTQSTSRLRITGHPVGKCRRPADNRLRRDLPTNLLLASWFILCCALVFHQSELRVVFYVFASSFFVSFLGSRLRPASLSSNAIAQALHSTLVLVFSTFSAGRTSGDSPGTATLIMALTSGYCLFDLFDKVHKRLYRGRPAVWAAMVHHTLLPIWYITALYRGLAVPLGVFAAPAAAEGVVTAGLELFTVGGRAFGGGGHSGSSSGSGAGVSSPFTVALWFSMLGLRISGHMALMWTAAAASFAQTTGSGKVAAPHALECTSTRVAVLFASLLLVADAVAVAAAATVTAKLRRSSHTISPPCLASRPTKESSTKAAAAATAKTTTFVSSPPPAPQQPFPPPAVPPHLWLIHGRLYDLGNFIDSHPGGRWAIEIGRGRDCTAMFESYHPFTDRHRLIAAQHACLEPPPASTAPAAATAASSPPRPLLLPPPRMKTDPFYAALCTRAQAAFEAAGLDTRQRGGLKATPQRLSYYGAVLVALAATYPAYVTGRWPAPLLFALAAWLAGAMGHDGSHFAVSAAPRLNYFACLGMALLSSPFMWMHQHTYAHHSHTNHFGRDPDLHHFRFLRTHPLQPWRPAHAAQRWRLYVYAWYSLVVFGEALWLPLQLLLDGTISGITSVPNAGAAAWAAQLLHLAVYLVVVVAAPVACGGGVPAVAVFLATSGLLFGFFSQVNHLNEGSVRHTAAVAEGGGDDGDDGGGDVQFEAHLPTGTIAAGAGEAAKGVGGGCIGADSGAAGGSAAVAAAAGADGGGGGRGGCIAAGGSCGGVGSIAGGFAAGGFATAAGSWAAEQVETSNNFCTASPLWTLLSNGLNFQIEHHLFPGVNHEHLQHIQPAVRAVCREFGVAYKTFDTTGAILAETARYYRLLA